MTHTPLLVKSDSKYLKIPTQVNSLDNPSVNRAFTAVAQETAGLLQQAYLAQAECTVVA